MGTAISQKKINVIYKIGGKKMKLARWAGNCTFALIMILAAALIVQSAFAGDLPYRFEYSVQFSRNDLSFDKLMNYDIVRLNDRSYLNSAGSPMMPLKTIRIALPEGMSAKGVSVIEINSEIIIGEFNILPAQPPMEISRSDERPILVEPNMTIYGSNSAYPPSSVEFVRQSDLAGQSMAVINLYPLRYIPAAKRLELLTSIRFVIEGEGGYECGDYLPENISQENLKLYEQRLKEISVNPEDVSLRLAISGKRGAAAATGKSFDHIIITSDANALYYQPLVTWHTRKGVKDTIITVGHIYANYSGADNQEKIRNFVKDAHENWGATYFLLAGENATVPFRFRTYDDESIPSDSYYGDYDDDWEYEVFVGRMTAEGSVEIGRFVNKLLKYEINPPLVDGNMFLYYLLEATLVGMDLTVPSDPPEYTLTRGEYLKDTVGLHIPERFIVTKVFDSKPGNHREDFLAALNRGVNLVNHCDHSNYNVMGVGDRNHDYYISSYDVLYLTNYHRYCIIYSLGCYANKLDQNDAISEYFVFSKDTTGAVAFTGNTRSGWFYLGDPMSLSSALDLQWWVGLFDHNKYRLGEALAYTKSVVNTDVIHPYSEWTLNLLGDPEMPVWTDIPVPLAATHPTALEALPSQFTVHVESYNLDVPDAYVCLWKGSEVYQRGYTDQNGNITLDIYPTTTGPLYVTATKRDYLPYQGQATVSGNTPPVCNVPNDTIVFQCTSAEIDFPVSCFDYEGNLSSGPELVKGSGEIINGLWHYSPTGNDSVAVTVRCIDSLGFFCETTFIVKFNLNDAPTCSVPKDTSITQKAPPAEIILPVTVYDQDGNIGQFSITAGPGTISDGFWRYTPSNDEMINISLRATDSCDVSGDASFHINYDVWTCGDADDNRDVNIIDISYLVRYIYKGGQAPKVNRAGDPNNSGSINLLDVAYLINYLYKEGANPYCP